MKTLSRRAFLRSGIVTGSVLAGTSWISAAAGKIRPASPNDRIGVALIGCGNQGARDLHAIIAAGQVDVPVVCDVDDSHAERIADEVERRWNRRPRTERDFRRVLERPDVGVVIVATPDHWHALITVLACEAGKDVYVEKPACHEMAEGRAMIRAARENRRVVQLGMQLRSTPHMKSAVDYVRSGKLGRVGFCRAWMCSQGRALKGGPGSNPPQGVDYDLWLGPAPARPFHPDRFHREWRWFGDYGTGQLGDRAVHLLDIVRWGMNVEFPKAVWSSGGIFHYRDGRDTPDTQIVTYDFSEFTVVWEHRQGSRRGPDAPSLGLAFYGSDATLVADYSGWEVHREPAGEVVEKTRGALEHAAHIATFLECVRSRRRPNADIETGVTTTAWCLLGIIAQKTRRKLQFDAAAGRFVGDDEANRLLARPYRAPWKMPEKYLA